MCILCVSWMLSKFVAEPIKTDNELLPKFLDHLQLLYADDVILHMRLNVQQSVMTEYSSCTVMDFSNV